MSKKLAVAVLLVVMIAVAVWTGLAWLEPAFLSGCLERPDSCVAYQFKASMILWRGLALELLAVVIYLLIFRQRTE